MHKERSESARVQNRHTRVVCAQVVDSGGFLFATNIRIRFAFSAASNGRRGEGRERREARAIQVGACVLLDQSVLARGRGAKRCVQALVLTVAHCARRVRACVESLNARARN